MRADRVLVISNGAELAQLHLISVFVEIIN